MNIQAIAISDIQRAKYNPRKTLKPGDPAYDRLKKAVATFGLVEPLVWNQRTKNLVGGHQRLSVLEERGDTSVEVSVVDLSEREEKALNLALNKHSGEWDFASLADMLQELDAGDMDMEITGFDAAELEKMMTWTAPNPGLSDEDAVPEPPKEPVTKLGDLWMLGGHRLLCGDSTKSANVAQLMGGEYASLMATDPPYLVDYDGLNHPSKWGRGRKSKNKDWSEQYGVHWNETGSDFALWVDSFTVAKEALAKNAAWYVWHADRLSSELRHVLIGIGVLCHQVIVWRKNRPVLTRSWFMQAHEACIFGWLQGHKPELISKEHATTVWDLAHDESKIGSKHPTQKPVELFAIPIRIHTNPGGICYEPFSGSGSQIIAAEKSGRRCYAVEIDPVYVDVAVERWQLFTGKEAVRA